MDKMDKNDYAPNLEDGTIWIEVDGTDPRWKTWQAGEYHQRIDGEDDEGNFCVWMVPLREDQPCNFPYRPVRRMVRVRGLLVPPGMKVSQFEQFMEREGLSMPTRDVFETATGHVQGIFRTMLWADGEKPRSLIINPEVYAAAPNPYGRYSFWEYEEDEEGVEDQELYMEPGEFIFLVVEEGPDLDQPTEAAIETEAVGAEE